MVSQLGKSDIPIEGRLRLIGAFIVVVFTIFVLRLFQLQIVEGEALRKRSEQNSVRTVRLEAPRGDILDREGRVLATTRPAYELQVIPNGLREPKTTFAALAQLLDTDSALLEDRVGVRKGAERFQPVSLVDDLDFDRLAKVETHRYALPGVVTDVQPRRHYVEGAMAAHLMGLIGEIDGNQLEKRAREGYRPGDIIGQAGLEALLESHLRGRAGGRNVVVDVAGREVEVLDEVAAVPGGKVVLALDLDLQREAEAAFLDVPDGEPAKMGAAVAMDVRTGDVLVMVSRPSYDPNAFAGGIDVETWNALTGDEWEPLQNRAIQNHYPPGSIHKPILAAALLADGIVTPETRVFCPGYFRHGRRTYRCWKRGGHGSVDIHEALKQSCDVYFYTNGVKLGIDRMAHYARVLRSRTSHRDPARQRGAGSDPEHGVEEAAFRGGVVSGRDGLRLHRSGIQPLHARFSWRLPTRRWRTAGRCSSRGCCSASRLGTEPYSRSSRPRSGARSPSRPNTWRWCAADSRASSKSREEPGAGRGCRASGLPARRARPRWSASNTRRG